MTETVLILNRTGRDITLSFVTSRQKVKKGGEEFTHPVHSISHTLEKAKVTEIPKIVWDSQKNTSLVKHYLESEPPKFEVVEKKTQVSNDKPDSDNDKKEDSREKLDPEQIELVAEALAIFAEDGDDKPTLKEISKAVGFKVSSALRDAAKAGG